VTFYGFDSFVGLPEHWRPGSRKRAFSRDGELPPVRANVKLIRGFFADTLPTFVAAHASKTISFMHVDCDLYSSTKTIFAETRALLAPGTIIVFDEYFNAPEWREEEYQGVHGVHCREQDQLRIYRLHPDRLAGRGEAVVRRSGPTKLVERMLDALTDPARRERTAVAVLLGYVALWTLYGTLAKASQDINSDMSEQYVLSRELAWGYPKHPPFAMVVVRAWFAVFPTRRVGFLPPGSSHGGARAVDRLAALRPLSRWGETRRRARPAHAGAVLQFPRVEIQPEQRADAALGGDHAVVPALVRDPASARCGARWPRCRGMHVRQILVDLLLLGLGIAALLDRRRAAYFRSGAPWVTIAAGALALAPHAAWLVANDFVPFSYAVAGHGSTSLVSALRGALGYLAGGVAYVAVPLVLVFVASTPKPSGPQRYGMAGNARTEARGARVLATLLLPPVIAILTWIGLNSLWDHVGIDPPPGSCCCPHRSLPSAVAMQCACSRSRFCLPFVMVAPRSGDCLRHSSRRAGTGRGPFLGAGRADRAAVAQDHRPAAQVVRRLRRLYRRRRILHAQPSARGARARRPDLAGDGAAHRP